MGTFSQARPQQCLEFGAQQCCRPLLACPITLQPTCLTLSLSHCCHVQAPSVYTTSYASWLVLLLVIMKFQTTADISRFVTHESSSPHSWLHCHLDPNVAPAQNQIAFTREGCAVLWLTTAAD